MITLITGTPGAGKSLYTVAEVVAKMVGTTIQGPNGETVPRRILVDGIKNLVLDHELLTPTKVGFDGDILPDQEGEGVHNWWVWAKPGDVIVIDEVQRYWRPRGNGSKVPRMIAELETHRHKGCDFVIVTQHPMLIDQNVRRLVGRHVHMRRMWGLNRAVRYEWDHCSSPEKVGDASKSYWPYPRDAFKFYKSAEVHTKQGGKPPLALAVLGLAMVALPVIGYVAVSRVNEMLNPVATPAMAVSERLSLAPPGQKPDTAPAAEAAGLPADTQTGEVVRHQTASYVGCISSATRCECFDAEGIKVVIDMEACRHASTTVLRVTASTPTGYGGSAPMSTHRDEQAGTSGPTTPRASINANPAGVAPAGGGVAVASSSGGV